MCKLCQVCSEIQGVGVEVGVGVGRALKYDTVSICDQKISGSRILPWVKMHPYKNFSMLLPHNLNSKQGYAQTALPHFWQNSLIPMLFTLRTHLIEILCSRFFFLPSSRNCFLLFQGFQDFGSPQKCSDTGSKNGIGIISRPREDRIWSAATTQTIWWG